VPPAAGRPADRSRRFGRHIEPYRSTGDATATWPTTASIPAVRGGLASGRVMMRDGDVFGPVVNLAARAVKVAQPGEVLVTADLAEAAGLRTEPRGHHRLKGVTSDVELRRLMHS
jgi:class 3 adenylate cyclase